MSLLTVSTDVAQFLSRLLPSDIPVYQVPFTKDSLTGEVASGIKFHGVVPIRDPKQPSSIQPRNITSLPDSRIEPISSNISGNKVFRFNGSTDQYIYYRNMFPGANGSWSLTMYCNLDTVASTQLRRTIMQTTGPGAAGEINIGLTRDGKVEVIIMGRADLKKYVQLEHNSVYIAMSYNSSRRELSIQVNNTVLDLYTNITLTAPDAIFGLSYERTLPFGPGYLGAITLRTDTVYNLDQLSRLARYVPLPEPPVQEETNIANGEDDTSNNNAGDIIKPPDVANDLELKGVSKPPVVVIDEVTGEKTIIPQNQNNGITSAGTSVPRFRHYNIQVPILKPPSEDTLVETFMASTAASTNDNVSLTQLNPVNNQHRQYHPR